MHTKVAIFNIQEITDVNTSNILSMDN